MRPTESRWISCQLGAREHYAVARALHSRGCLERLITDLWVAPGSALDRLAARCGAAGRRLQERTHAELAETATVEGLNGEFLFGELTRRMTTGIGWPRTMARNAAFGRAVARRLRRMAISGPGSTTVFAYSYAAMEILEAARARGWRTVLGQIDPGPKEAELVAAECAARPEQKTLWRPPPPDYWVRWRRECALADRVMVNSQWAAEALAAEGVSEKKLWLVPLTYDGAIGRDGVPPEPLSYPERFDTARPLRVLFLGQINLRKGVARLLDAARLLRDAPVEFYMVGPLQINDGRAPRPSPESAPVHWLGPVARGRAAAHYREADLFILPTLSDGFALTQLEALAHRLPIIASRRCGEVVSDGVNGLLYPNPLPKRSPTPCASVWPNPHGSLRSRPQHRWTLDLRCQPWPTGC